MVSFICYTWCLTSTPLCGPQRSSYCCWGCEEQLVHLLLAEAFCSFWNCFNVPPRFPLRTNPVALQFTLFCAFFCVVFKLSAVCPFMLHLWAVCWCGQRGRMTPSLARARHVYSYSPTYCLPASKQGASIAQALPVISVTTDPSWVSRSCMWLRMGMCSPCCVRCYGDGYNLCQFVVCVLTLCLHLTVL